MRRFFVAHVSSLFSLAIEDQVMNEASILSSFYKVGGALPQDVPSYVTRESDLELYEALKAGEFCYVLNSRQMGKSSLMVRSLAKLQAEDWAGIIIDFSGKDSQTDMPDRWYNGITNQLNSQFNLLDFKDFLSWLKERDFISPVERLGEFIETVLLPGIERPIVIFIDEIDSTLKLPFTDDFFALIRACYNKRAENTKYQRLTFALFGVAAPSDLISDAQRTPFNIGKSIDLKGFTLQEARPLAEGLAAKSDRPQKVLQEILHWTGGQPFLTQRLCQLVADSSFPITSGSEATLIEGLVRSRIIEHWESQDQQEHLKTIRKRLLDNEQKAGYLLELYRQIRRSGEITAHNRSEDQELRLTGLVVKRDGKLQVYNPIYEVVFDEAWIDAELNKLRPYAESFRAWIASGKTDSSRLLRGEALAEAEQWAAEKATLNAEDREFLSACRTQQREEEISAKEREAELAREKKAREAAEEAEKIQAEANRKAQHRIRIGSIALGITLFGAVIAAGFGLYQVQEALKAQNKAKEAIEQQQEAEKQFKEVKDQLDKANDDIKKADQRVKEAQEQENKAKKQAEEAETKVKEAEKLVQKANQELKDAQQAKTEAEKALAKTNQALEAVRGLSVLAGELRRNGEVEASNEALRKAGISTLIENEELKQTFLLAATAEAYQSLGDEGLEKAQDILNKLSLSSLDNNKSKLNPSILNQVKAFAYFLAGKFKGEKNYQYAYDALKANNFDPFNPNLETDVLNEKDVENIHWELIKSSNIDINSETDPIAISFRKHLYAGLESLLKKDRLQEADVKTFEIMLYIAGTKERGFFTVESLENFDCQALREIDSLWLDYPESGTGHFGFSLQKEIWQKNGSPTFDSPIEIWRKFYIDLGWKTEESGIESGYGYVNYYDLGAFNDKLTSKKGNLPAMWSRRTDWSLWIETERAQLHREWSKRAQLIREFARDFLKYPLEIYLVSRAANCNL